MLITWIFMESMKQFWNRFGSMSARLKMGAFYLLRHGLEIADATKARVYTYSLEEGDYHASDIHIENARFVFDLKYPEGVISGIAMKIPGFHNIENSIAASAAALYLGVNPEEIKLALESYKGVKRRFEYQVESPEHIYIDDYAHHPAEIEAFLSSVKALYPGRHITAVFQPHLFTRTRDFAEGFAKSLSLADRLILLDIYPARELPIPGVNAEMVLDMVEIEDKKIVGKGQVLEAIKAVETDILVTIGAGDIDTLVLPLKAYLENSFAN